MMDPGKTHVESLEELGQLRDAIDRNDLTGVQNLMTRNPGLHKARLGYGKDGPLTLAAECGVPTESRLSIARWMIENGSDVHQGGDGPLMRAALSSNRIPMMELLVSHGANVNAEWHNEYPIIFAACEAVDPVSLKWLLDHGANPNCDRVGREHRGTALEYVIGSMCGHPSSVLVSIYSLEPAASANTMLSCWMHSVGIWTVWPHISTRTPQSHTAVSLNWISAPRVDVCSRSAAPCCYILLRNT